MEKRRLGNSELEISPLVYGGFAIGGFMWGGADENDAIASIHAAIDGGVNLIDTAPLYGFGRGEEIVGKALKSRKGRALIATKGGLRHDKQEGDLGGERMGLEGEPVKWFRNSRPKELIWECEQSLRRLQVEEIDLYQIHWPDTSVPIEDAVGALLRLQEQGKIRAIGVSNYNITQMQKAISVAQIDSLQPPYSIIRRGIEKEILPFCIQNNIGTITYSPLERGLLSGKISAEKVFEPNDHRLEHPYFKVENRKKVLSALEGIKPICDKHRATFAQVILNWTLQQKGVTGVIVGARNSKQMEENLGAMKFSLSAEEMLEMESIFKEECASFCAP